MRQYHKITAYSARLSFVSFFKMLYFGNLVFWTVFVSISIIAICIKPSLLELDVGANFLEGILRIAATIIVAPPVLSFIFGVPAYLGLLIFQMVGGLKLVLLSSKYDVEEQPKTRNASEVSDKNSPAEKRKL